MTEQGNCPLIAPQTPASAARLSGTGGWLPDDFVSEQVARLSLFSAVGVGLWALGLIIDGILLPQLPGAVTYSVGRAKIVEAFGVMGSLAMLAYVRYSPHGAQTKTEVSLAFLLYNAAAIALLNNWVLQPPTAVTEVRLSWITILILVYSMIAPLGPRTMLAGSLAAASMDPLGVWVAHLGGAAVTSVGETFVLFLPNYSCAVIATLACRMVHRLGRQLRRAQEMGSYELVERLGQGGMGEVWRARHHLLARGAAIKLIRPEVLGAGSGLDAQVLLRRFEREAQAIATLSSPHTIQLFDFGLARDGRFYYVMELLAGRDLETLVRDFGPVPADRAVFLLRQVCHSLADAHARGLVHRDIKPANIYLCRMGLEYDFVKVLDFGLVKFGGPAATETLVTSPQVTTGTPAYMAPEIILGEAGVDRRADVYALGCVAYYLVTGQLVFEGDTAMKVMMQHVQAEPIPPSQRTELPVPKEVDAIIMACLAKNPDGRPQDAAALFHMACGCTSCDTWNQDRARVWWERHLTQLTGPLTMPDQRPTPAGGGPPGGRATHSRNV